MIPRWRRFMSFTHEEAQRLISLVNVAKTIADLGVVPVRTWRLVGKCERHGRVIEDEITLTVQQQPPTSIVCPLCVVGRIWSSDIPCDALLLRG